MGTTGRFGGGLGINKGPQHVWYDTDYSELYRGLAVVIGFFLFLVLLLLIFILISYLRKWYRLKKRPAEASVASAPSAESSVKSSALVSNDEAKYGKKYSKTGLPSSQPTTPLVKSMPKSSLSSTPVEFVDGKMVKSGATAHHGQHQQYHQNIAHHHQHYQEFPPTHFPAHHMPSGTVQPHSILSNKGDSQPTNPRTCRPSLATITLT